MAVVADTVIGSDEKQCGGNGVQESECKDDGKNNVDLAPKLNPLAEEFVPCSKTLFFLAGGRKSGGNRLSADAPAFVFPAEWSNGGSGNKDENSDGSSRNQHNQQYRRRRNGYNQRRRRMSASDRRNRDNCIRRTVYVSDIDHYVTEDDLATLFSSCGQVRDCRICGDPHSPLRFAFIEFEDDDGARTALSLAGTVLGLYPVRVLPSKTAILPVNPSFLPQSEDEKEMVTRTVYCTNIDKKATQTDVKNFFEVFCGKVSRLRLLGDHAHSTRIAFVEFAHAESAFAALNCSGMVLGSLPIRVSPSKTPVRPRVPRANSSLIIR